MSGALASARLAKERAHSAEVPALALPRSGESATARPLRRIENRAAHARWEAVVGPPHPGLAPWVDGDYYGWREQATQPLRRLEAASSIVPLILNFGPPIRVSTPGHGPADGTELGSFTAGLSDGHAITESIGESVGLQVNLTPLGAYRVLGVPMHSLSHRVVAFDAVLGSAGARLLARLRETPDWGLRFDLVDAFLAARCASGKAPDAGVVWAWRRLEESAGGAAIGGLVADLGWSHRRLIERFREQIGLAPKTMARVLRFHRVVRLLRERPDVDWADVAYDAGYFDQSHLIRDFGAFAGTTPTEYKRRSLPEGGGVLAE